MNDLARLGGKGANLVRLADAGLPVPPFVVVETTEYRAFVDAAGLRSVIADALNAGPTAGSGAVAVGVLGSNNRCDPAVASATIRAAFAAASLPRGLHDRLAALVAPLPPGPVAVRSSATAEDQPGFSFAGLHDTFLNVAADDVPDRLVDCWSSLWTERAIAYRERNGISHDDAAIAVVVQTMVDATASGVLFTANPRTGRRDETVVDAAPGLGEALVSGQVTPDNFTLDPATGDIREQEVAGDVAPVTPAHLATLAALGRRIASIQDAPVDVEWARVGDELFVLQARPITSLYPLPAPNPAPHDFPELWFSFGAFQGMLEPMTPLGQEAIRILLAGASRLVGRRVDWRISRFVQPAGERLWLRLDGVLRIRSARALAFKGLPMVDPGAAAIIAGLADEPGLRATHATPPPSIAVGVAGVLSRVAPRVRTSLTNAPASRRHLDRVCEELVADVARSLDAAAAAATPQARLSARLGVLDRMGDRFFPALLPAFAPIMGPTFVLLSRLREAARKTNLPDADTLALNVLRALPGNVTTEMDLVLADVAVTIRSDATAWGWVAETPASDLARQYLSGNLPTVAQNAIGQFLAQYGMRGVAEIDLGVPRWRDDPTPVMNNLKSYVAVSDPRAHPRALHTERQHEAGRSIRLLMDASPRARARQIRDWARSIRGMFGARETPKFTIVRAFGLLREHLDASARELVEAGRLSEASDVYFLHTDELRRAFTADWQHVVAERRAVKAAEARRGQVPRVLLEDGRAFYEGLGAASGDLSGAGVSPGVAEGPVRVVLDPRVQQLQAGDILVCPGTDPAWTPLFLSAAGLITEVGGLMTHGSVVAREYGIPAIVGVHEATTRLVDGQRVRIDGASGVIELMDGASKTIEPIDG